MNKKFIYLHAIPLFLFLMYSAIFSFCAYMGGLRVVESNEYFGIRFSLMMLFLPFLFVVFIYYVIILFKVGKKYVIPSIALMIFSSFIFLYTFTWGMVSCPVKGYYNYVQNNVNIDKIHDWMMSYEFNEYDEAEYGIVREFNWPESIKSLKPSRGVKILKNEGKKYLRISHGVDIELSIGLCVMEEPMDVPIGSRIELQDNAFVWAGN